MANFWDIYHIPIQEEFSDLESINPAEAYRRQAQAVNVAGTIYPKLEELENHLSRIDRMLSKLNSKILSQNMPLPSSATRNSDLLDAFIYDKAHDFINDDDEYKDVSDTLLDLRDRKKELENEINQLNRRIRALESMAEKCDRIMNWAKHEHRIEMNAQRY